MITLRKKLVYDDSHNIIDVKLERKDYGVSFADYVGECEIEGHITEVFSTSIHDEFWRTQYIERCTICQLEREVIEYKEKRVLKPNGLWGYEKLKPKIGEWKPSTCAECEENCIISRPLNPKCPNCGSTKNNGIYHTNGGSELLFDCFECNKQDQEIS